MKRASILFFLLSISSITFGQWIVQNSGTEQHLQAVQFLDAEIGLVVGDNGTILKTTNGGADWVQLSSNTDINLHSISFINKDIGYVAGRTYHQDLGMHSNIILKTTNGGINWEEIQKPNTATILKVVFLTEQIGFSSCGTDGLYKTETAGASWVKVSHKTTGSVFFLSSNLGYALMGAGIAKTEDGGISWEQKKDGNSPDYNSANILKSLFFTSNNKGYFGSPYYGAIYSTSDGANSLEFNGTTSIAIDFPSKNTGFLIGGWDGSIILQTKDAGQSWDLIRSTFKETKDLYFVNDFRGWFVGNEGKILHYNLDVPDDASLAEKITVYPNPSSGQFNIELDRDLTFISLKVYDSLGRQIKSQSIFEKTIELDQEPNGAYFFHIETKSGTFSQKVMKK